MDRRLGGYSDRLSGQETGKFLLRGLAVDEPMLAEFLDQVTGWTALAVTLSAALTGHPQWKGHPLDQELTETGNSRPAS